MEPLSTCISLNNGIEMPALGLGVFLAQPDETAKAVETAITNGYRLVDTAAAYHNERQVGEGIRNSSIDRRELFITTKLWMTDYGYESALKAFGVSLNKLGLEYLDLYLLHWPMPTDFAKTIQAYKAATQLMRDGRVRAIGVSNFSAVDLENLLRETEVMPSVNQVEMNPFFTQNTLRAEHEKLGIVTQAWSPIGGVYDRNPKAAPEAAKSPLEHPVITALSQKYGKTPAQVILRWHIEQGVSAIPKSVNSERIKENIDIFDFTLSSEEVSRIDGLDTGIRAGSDPQKVKADTFPIKIEV